MKKWSPIDGRKLISFFVFFIELLIARCKLIYTRSFYLLLMEFLTRRDDAKVHRATHGTIIIPGIISRIGSQDHRTINDRSRIVAKVNSTPSFLELFSTFRAEFTYMLWQLCWKHVSWIIYRTLVDTILEYTISYRHDILI